MLLTTPQQKINCLKNCMLELTQRRSYTSQAQEKEQIERKDKPLNLEKPDLGELTTSDIQR